MKKILLITLACLTSISMFSQSKSTISGKVTDAETGAGLPFSSIAIKGTSKGVNADYEGKYSIEVTVGDTLIYGMVGYLKTTRIVSSAGVIDVALQIEQIKEVLVVGYGTQEAEDVTGSVVQVTSDEITQTVVPVAADALQGRAAGVQVVKANGAPGGAAEVTIRGISSINPAPVLYIVDGIPLDGPAVNAISPSDIESINILKDASAAAIYGARAAGGVIIITTKRGKSGKPVVSYDTYYGSQRLIKKLDVLDGEGFARATNLWNTNQGLPAIARFQFPEDYAGIGTDWQDAIFQTGSVYNSHVAVNGGAPDVRYAISGDYFNEQGIVPTSFYERYSFRANLDFDFSEHVKFGFSSSYTRDGGKGVSFNNSRAEGSTLLAATTLDPTAEIVRQVDSSFNGGVGTLVPEGHELYNPNDSLYWNQIDFGNTPNMVAQLSRNTRDYGMTWTDKLLGNAYLEILPVKGVTLRSSLGTDYSYQNGWGYSPIYFIEISDRNQLDQLSRHFNRWFSYNWENTIKIDKTIKKHKIGLLGGTTAYDWNNLGFNISKRDLGGDVNLEFPITELLTSTGPQNDSLTTIGDWIAYRRLASIFGRLDYEFNDKYFLTVNVRRDGSSQFGPARKFGVFPGLSAGWKISNEKFFEKIKNGEGLLSNINFLKLRGGYGVIGNSQAAGDFQYLAGLVDRGSRFVFGPDGSPEQLGSWSGGLGNPFLAWESMAMTNVALDMGLFQNKIWFTGEMFVRNTSDMIMGNNTQPISSGFDFVAPGNIASMTSRGVEFEVKYKSREKEFKYDVGVNFSRVRNNLVSLIEGNDVIYGGANQAMSWYTKTTVGTEIGGFYGYEVEGIFQTDAEAQNLTYVDANGVTQQTYGNNVGAGDYRYRDQNGDGILDENDIVNIGSPYADFVMGMNANAQYKGFDFNLFTYWNYGNEIFNTSKLYMETGYESSNMRSYMLTDAWTPDNPNATIAQLGGDFQNNYATPSDAYIESGSFFRFKNIMIGYTLPEKVVKKIGLTKLRVYANLQNYITISKYSGRDPELGNTWGIFVQKMDIGNYTVPKTMNFGLNATF